MNNQVFHLPLPDEDDQPAKDPRVVQFGLTDEFL